MEAENSGNSSNTSHRTLSNRPQKNVKVSASKVHPDLMTFGQRTITKRKVAFIACLLVNALITLGQQIFMLQMFY